MNFLQSIAKTYLKIPENGGFFIPRFCSIIILGFLFSCNSQPDKNYENIFSREEGDLRGISIRSSLEEVKMGESASPKNEESDYLFYEFKLPQQEENFTLGYSFNTKGLYEILLDVNLKKPEDALALYLRIKENFTTRFGNPEQEDESSLVWTIKGKNSEEVEVTLSDESEGSGSGKISVSFYDLAY